MCFSWCWLRLWGVNVLLPHTLHTILHLLLWDTVFSSRWHHPPVCTGRWLSPAETGEPHRSPQAADTAPGTHLNLQTCLSVIVALWWAGDTSLCWRWVRQLSQRPSSVTYPLRSCSTGKGTSTRCPGRQHFPPQPGGTPPYCPIGPAPPTPLAGLVMHTFYSKYWKGSVSAQLSLQSFSLWFAANSLWIEQLPNQLMSFQWLCKITSGLDPNFESLTEQMIHSTG